MNSSTIQNLLCRVGFHSGTHEKTWRDNCTRLYVCANCGINMTFGSGYGRGNTRYWAGAVFYLAVFLVLSCVVYILLPVSNEIIKTSAFLGFVITGIVFFVFQPLDSLYHSASGREAILNEHDFTKAAYVEPDKCEMQSVCTRCGKTRSSVSHVYGPEYVDEEEPCEIKRKCERCGDIREWKTEHNFDNGVFVKENQCGMVLTCKKCGYKKEETHHNHEETYSNHFVCKRCGHSYDSEDDSLYDSLYDQRSENPMNYYR